jgi:hypothetical protein
MQDRINQVDETSCTARPDHTVGSTTALTAPKRDFRSVPESRRSQCSLACLKRANIGSTGRDAKHHRARFGRKFDEPIALPNGRDAPMTLASAANAF